MSRQSKRPYLILIALLLMTLSFSKTATEALRGKTVAFFAPMWEGLSSAKLFITSPLAHLSKNTYISEKGPKLTSNEEIQRLQLENRLLGEELLHVQDLFHYELNFNNRLNHFFTDEPISKEIKEGYKKHRELIQYYFNLQLQAIPARVIFRSAMSWNSSLWLNVGEADNAELKTKVICKNSPVIIGTSLVGVIDYVGKNQSRVRLITDPGLTPSVRATRGDLQKKALERQVESLLESLDKKNELTKPIVDIELIQKALLNLKSSLASPSETYYLAKGELHGSRQPLWRKQGNILKGTGFNYDFPDEDEDTQGWSNGNFHFSEKDQKNRPILQLNDLLVTTGMDGVFPSGLEVGIVTQVYPFKEGDYFYELNARPTAGNLDELSLVFVIPPLGYNNSDQPPLIGQ